MLLHVPASLCIVICCAQKSEVFGFKIAAERVPDRQQLARLGMVRIRQHKLLGKAWLTSNSLIHLGAVELLATPLPVQTML